jgi:hypothetical protein
MTSGHVGCVNSYEEHGRQVDMDGLIRCFYQTLEREEHLKMDFLETRLEDVDSGFHKKPKISSATERLLAAQEVYTIELIRQNSRIRPNSWNGCGFKELYKDNICILSLWQIVWKASENKGNSLLVLRAHGYRL